MKLRKQDSIQRRPPREVIEVEVERLGVRPSRAEVIRKRAIKFITPVILGGLVDFGDFFTSSPILAPIAMPIGMVVGYLFGRRLELPPTWCFLVGALVGVYWIVPFTSLIPVGLLVAGFVAIFKPGMLQHDHVSPES